ncbi:MAG: hypothetical protein M0036_17225 [Desulfobacteraceae bacterium]|nr:hypothetical protein [Desulfobacteraceae bacterium]
MKLGAAIVQKLFGSAIERQVAERLPAAVGLQLDQIGWRRLTGAPTRELAMMDQGRAIEVAYWLWKTNPLAKWIIEVVVAYVAAKGSPYTCANEAVKDVLDEFWQDPVNRMDIHFENFVRELGIYGEQCWPAFVAEQTGRVRLGYIDPALIQSVHCDPHNVKIKVGVVVGGTNAEGPRRLAIVLDDDNEQFLSEAGKALRDSFSDGKCFFFTINALTNEMRGTSDLFTVADHLDNYEQFLFDSGDKHARFNSFFYDITVTGADEKKLATERANYEPPKNGGAFIHNEKVTAQAVNPDFKSEDSQQAARLHRNHILGSLGLPEHWFGGGGDVNRATAAEMDGPARKIIEKRQELVKNMLERMFDYVISSAANARYLRDVPEDELYSYEIQTPEISDKDVAKLSTMLTQVSAALTTAEVQGWISKDEAAKAFAFFLAFVGYEYNPEGQENAPEYEDYKKQNEPLNPDQGKPEPGTRGAANA